MPQTEAQRLWYQNNKEYCKAKTARYREKYPEKNREYYYRNIDRYKAYYQSNKEAFSLAGRKRYEKLAEENPEKILWKAAKARAKEKNLEFDIEISDIIIPEHCPVYGIKLYKAVGQGRPLANSPTIDRLDNTKGYIKNNINVISYRANTLKKDASAEEIRKLLDWMDRMSSNER